MMCDAPCGSNFDDTVLVLTFKKENRDGGDKMDEKTGQKGKKGQKGERGRMGNICRCIECKHIWVSRRRGGSKVCPRCRSNDIDKDVDINDLMFDEFELGIPDEEFGYLTLDNAIELHRRFLD